MRELLSEMMDIERDLNRYSKYMNSLPLHNKVNIVNQLDELSNLYNKNLENIKKIDYNHIKKDLKKIEKVIIRLQKYKEKLKNSIAKEVI